MFDVDVRNAYEGHGLGRGRGCGNTMNHLVIRCRCGCLCVLLLVAGCSSSESAQNKRAVTFPSVDDVTEIRAAVHNSFAGYPDVPEFVVPPEHWKALLDKFEPVKPSTLCDELRETGTLRIKLRDEGLVVVHWYWNGQNPLEFVVNGRRCIRGEYGRFKTDQGEMGFDEGLMLEGFVRRLRAELLKE